MLVYAKYFTGLQEAANVISANATFEVISNMEVLELLQYSSQFMTTNATIVGRVNKIQNQYTCFEIFDYDIKLRLRP
jgi:hypothetical protein